MAVGGLKDVKGLCKKRLQLIHFWRDAGHTTLCALTKGYPKQQNTDLVGSVPMT